jgi:hypothetical protein
MYATEYAARSLFRASSPDIPAMLNAVGACAGFAAQAAVWHGLILPGQRNPGDFVAYVGTASKETFFIGDAINYFLLSTDPGRLSFLSLAGACLTNHSELPDVKQLISHVAASLGKPSFGHPRLPPSVRLRELPRAALARTWPKAAEVLQDAAPVDWPAMLGAAALNMVTDNRQTVSPSIAVRILLEAAAPMSKLDPRTVPKSGVSLPALNDWSNRAILPAHAPAIQAEVHDAMPANPEAIRARPRVIDQPSVAFWNLSKDRFERIAAEDHAQIGGIFRKSAQHAARSAVVCDVLFLYGSLDASGTVAELGLPLSEVIAKSGASVAVMASEVAAAVLTSPGFQKALQQAPNVSCNLVITGSRNGQAFARFFRELFRLMADGEPMPVAWGKLAPQVPNQPRDIPGTICLIRDGRLAFNRLS